MERLTKREISGITYNNSPGFMCSCYCDNCSKGTGDCDRLKAMVNRLAKFEDLEEQGLLVRLPCPLGTTVYGICGTDIRKDVVDGIEYGGNGRYCIWSDKGGWLGELGDLVFLTREEAEKKLEEMKAND